MSSPDRQSRTPDPRHDEDAWSPPADPRGDVDIDFIIRKYEDTVVIEDRANPDASMTVPLSLCWPEEPEAEGE